MRYLASFLISFLAMLVILAYVYKYQERVNIWNKNINRLGKVLEEK